MTKKDGLYHKDIYLPDLHIQPQVIDLIPSAHAIESAKTDRYGKFTLPVRLNLKPSDIIEIEIQNNQLVKFLVRIRYNARYDLTLAIAAENLIIKTGWLNLHTDQHRTLNPNAYQKKN